MQVQSLSTYASFVVVFVSYQYFKEKKKQNLRTKLKPNPSKPLVFGHIRDLTRQNYVYWKTTRKHKIGEATTVPSPRE